MDEYGNDLLRDAQSPVYRTEPQGAVKDQPWFFNCVVRLKAASDIWAPEGLLSALLDVESRMGRRRTGPAGGPRVIDLDLLLFGAEVRNSEFLTLPHPRMFERAFVLVPLRDIAPDLIFPDGRGVDAALSGIEYALDGDTILQK